MATAMAAGAQSSGSNSPYSRYGLGLENQRVGAAASGMAGAGIAMRNSQNINALNPASYSAVDSMALIFDIGMSLQNGNFSENGRKVNARNSSLDYVTAAFRAAPNVGISLGLLPFTTVGYSMKNTRNEQTGTGELTQTNTYSGDGGIHNAFIGAAWQPFKPISIGASIGYLWGNTTNTILASFSDGNMESTRRQYNGTVHSYKFDVGLQYTQRINKKNSIALGLTYGLGHDLSSREDFYNQIGNSSTSGYKGDTTVCHNAYQLPHTFGAGLEWNHNNRLRVAFDYTFQKWADVKSPTVAMDDEGKFAYTTGTGAYKNRNRFAVGAEFTPNAASFKWRDHVSYRAGFSYSTPYVYINGKEGPKDLCASVGVSLPIVSPSHTDRAINLNVGFQYERVQPSASSMLKEQYLRLTLGITFCETWFMKWRAR